MHHLLGDLVVDHRLGHVAALQQVDDGPRGLLVLVGRDGRLGPDNHRHEGQDRDQRQGTKCKPRHKVRFLN